MSNWVPTIAKITDVTDTVSASTVNPIIQGFSDRTQYLYDKLNSISNKEVLIALKLPVAQAEVANSSIVYYDYASATKGLRLTNPTLVGAAGQPYISPASSSYILGIVKERNSGEADVYLQGVIEIDVTTIIDQATIDLEFTGGPLYLSKTSGKLSSSPSGLAIYVGYAHNLESIYLNPSQNSLAEFFWNYKYKLIDRPAGYPTNDGNVWTINSADSRKVGWILANPNDTRTPVFGTKKAKYFYQLPSIANIDAYNTELSDEERAQAKELSLALPPNPGTFSFLFVNGVLFNAKTTETDENVYVINDYGLWWFDDTDISQSSPPERAEYLREFNQPWASDLHTTLLPTSWTASTDVIVVPNSVFAVDDEIVFWQSGSPTKPAAITIGTSYYVETVDGTSITLKDNGGSTINLANDGTFANVYIRWLPAYWDFAKGTEALRPRLSLYFTKLNPDIKQTVVTSLNPYDTASASPSIKVLDYTTELPSTTGDLKLKLNMPVNTVVSTTSTGTAVKSIAFDQTTESLSVSYDNVIKEIRNGGGLAVATDTATGISTISFATAQSNLITDLEPEQARLLYYGLHSYLALDFYTAPCGLVGKFVLPDQIVGTNLYINLLALGTANGTASNNMLKFKFEYAVSKLDTVLTSNITASTTDFIRFDTTRLAYKLFEVNSSSVSFDTGSYLFKIPVTNLAPKAVVNFRIHRLKNQSDSTDLYYKGVLGVVSTYWTLV